ncbi:PREDICTED: LRR receptor [Prunus dulcis]|uniref:PREDICTED: LRR receptor n=1 Tax=Prunus dulcis TaxID=3755 RepID=A0A5E4FX75_PRUDU|nr:PREDICTED: LRR receptor [Prunus dulcis]
MWLQSLEKLGKIPDCFRNCKNLVVVNLESNNLIGNIPRTLGYLHWSLKYLHLHGELPPYLKKCTELTILDLSYNKFLGKIPMWIGTSLSILAVLSLRSNQFHGHIPYKLCDLTFLRILDLAHNNISGRMPRCLYKFKAMASNSEISHSSFYYGNNNNYDNSFEANKIETAILVSKGREVKYGSILPSLAISLDLSDNIISGEIPEELTSLIYLQSVNLSYNLLRGRIPPKIENAVQYHNWVTRNTEELIYLKRVGSMLGTRIFVLLLEYCWFLAVQHSMEQYLLCSPKQHAAKVL